MKSFTRHLIYTIIALLPLQIVLAQSVGIGTASPNPSARLEVNSTSQGILIPTLTTAQRSAIGNPATGLLVFQTDGTPGFYYYTDTSWLNLTNGQPVNNDGVSPNYGFTITIAGSGSPGSADGVGKAATFYYPTGIAVDLSGNIYVADNFTNKIRKITTSGVVSTLAGSGTSGFADGFGTAASFGYVLGIAADAFGNVYVADASNNRIRKITPAGLVSTLAGNGLATSVDGIGNAASIHYPAGVAVDASGNIYVAESRGHNVRKITPAGVVSTLAGSGTYGYADGAGTAAAFFYPLGVTVDASGNVYVSDSENQRIRKINAAGVVTTLAGSGAAGYADGIGAAASLNYPNGIALDALGNLYVVDAVNIRIRKISAAGVVSTLAGNGSSISVDGIGTAASFNNPFGTAVDAAGNVYVTDRGGHQIRKIIAH